MAKKKSRKDGQCTIQGEHYICISRSIVPHDLYFQYVAAWLYLLITLEIPFSVVTGEANRSLINFALYSILLGESTLNKCKCLR